MTFDVRPRKMVTVKENAIGCPRCRDRIHGIRVTPETRIERLSVRCRKCGFIFLADYQPGPELHESQRH